jgi:circadian clock protein KaiB
MPELQLELYVLGDAPTSRMAVLNLRRICDERGPNACSVQVVDILENPEAAEQANIVATPTLIRRFPPPVRRIVGDLSDTRVVLEGLELEDVPPRRAGRGIGDQTR